jgi:flagellar motor switch protein FliG
MIFSKKKVIIKNPDESVVNYMDNYENKFVSEIMAADPKKLSKVLAQYDLKSIAQFLSHIPKKKSIEIFEHFTDKKKKSVIGLLPSKIAAAASLKTHSS